MVQRTTNTAYDFSRFEKKRVKNKPELKVITNKAPKQKILSLKNLAYVVVAVIAIAVTIYNRVILTELSAQVSSYETQLEELQSETVRLKTQAEIKLSSTNIEEQATKKLGLVKPDSSQIRYVDMSQGDKVETNSSESGIVSKLLMMLQPMLEYITD